jgi:hypothetical protein
VVIADTLEGHGGHVEVKGGERMESILLTNQAKFEGEILYCHCAIILKEYVNAEMEVGMEYVRLKEMNDRL